MAAMKWWQGATFYQIYPRSFADGNGDGIGDFPGIIAKLDYLRDLGIDAIWLSPHFPSPFLDCGYDIADYRQVAPEYGTLADFTRFLQEAHRRGLRIILDLVLNHTSDQHPWFVEARSSRDNPKRDWYVWRDGIADAPPNNWASIFGGSAWQHDALTDQYYYHVFLKEQPDLNWRNPEVKAAMWDAVRFWLDLGVDGFRLDALATIYEHPDLPNHSLPMQADAILDANAMHKADYQELLRYQLKQPGLHELLQELRALVDEYPGDRLLVGEDADVSFHGANHDELHLVFNFPLLETARLTPAHIRTNQALRLAQLPPGAWPCNTLGHHDAPRLWSRFGNGLHDAALARLHLVLLLTLKGTPFLFNGEEIGMQDLVLQTVDQLRDTAAINQYWVQTQKLGVAPDTALQAVIASTRDRCRSPLQWRNAPNAGFCPPAIAPWLPVNPNYADGVNVADQERDPNSLLNFYRNLLQLRRATPALAVGEYVAIHPHSDTYLAFLRQTGETAQTCLVVLNFADTAQTVRFDFPSKQPHLLFASPPCDPHSFTLDALPLAPLASLIVQLD